MNTKLYGVILLLKRRLGAHQFNSSTEFMASVVYVAVETEREAESTALSLMGDNLAQGWEIAKVSTAEVPPHVIEAAGYGKESI